MPLAAQPLFQCHCHSILTLFPSRHHQADVFCLGIMPLRHWGYRLLLLLLLSVMLLGDAVAFLVSVTNSVPCCWHHHHRHPLPSPSIAVAVDHCRHHCRRPLSSPSPSTIIITSLMTVDHLNIRHRRLIVILLFLFVVACCLTCFCHCCHCPSIMRCCHHCHR